MDPRLNPYAPGAGTPPPKLAGRDELIERAAIALDRIRAGRSSRSFIYYGLRGVGKTVLLNRIRLDAERRGDVLDIQHTFTPPAVRGREIAARLTAAAFDYARAEGLRIVPTCSYTAQWVARHPEMQALVRDA